MNLSLVKETLLNKALEMALFGVITYTFVVGLPWCNIQIYLLFYSELFFTWCFSMDHYSLSHFRALCSRVSLPGLRFISPLRCFQWWPSSFEQSSRSDMVHTVIEGPIRWRHVYMVRSGICVFSLILLFDVYKTPMIVLLGWSWWPMIIYVLMLEIVLRLIKGLDVEDYCSCHAYTNSKP